MNPIGKHDNKHSLPKTIVIGGANLDIAGSCEDRLIPGDSNPGVVKTSAGGVGRNISENLARLGFPCSLIAAVGDDVGKVLIQRTCNNAGVNCDHLIEYPNSTTGSYLAIHNQLGALVAAIADMSIMESLTPQVLETKRFTIKQHDQIVADANLSVETLHWIAEERDLTPLLVDAVSETKATKIRGILEHIELLKVNRNEAMAILDAQDDDVSLAKSLIAKGVKNVLLSQGPKGAFFCNAQGTFHKDAIKGRNSGDTGAGDALFAGFIAARDLLIDPADQLEFAIACATITLNSTLSVNPLISIELIKSNYLSHIKQSHWRSVFTN